jgi:ribosomal protein S18 acetylase RimI-like enzyme
MFPIAAPPVRTSDETIPDEPPPQPPPARGDRTRQGPVAAIRSLSPADREPIRQLLIETDVFTPAEIDIALELIDKVVNEPDQKDYIAFSCVNGGDVLGYYCIGATPGTEGTFDLYWIAVRPSAQGNGVGRRLIQHAESIIRASGGRLIIVETSSQPRYDRTRKFYHDQGYSQVSLVKDYYRAGDDLVVFGKYLT